MKAVCCLVACFCAALALAGCARPEATIRYKFTLTIETPEGVKTGSNVVQLDYYNSFDGGGYPHRTYGQALVIDLGRRGVLAATLSRKGFLPDTRNFSWVDADPTSLVLDKCVGGRAQAVSAIDVIRQLLPCKDRYSLDRTEFPDLILFKESNDPSSAAVVDPFHPATTLGQTVKIQSATLEITNDAITYEVDRQLPWVRHWSGKIALPPNYWTGTISNWLGRYDFIEDGEG